MVCECLKTELGYVCITEEDDKVVSIKFEEKDRTNGKINTIVRMQILDYFSGSKKLLDFPVKVKGTEFQRKVWMALREIPYGEVLTYAELAAKLGTSPRAIGQALMRNPLPIYFPCHRVVAKRSLGGFTPDLKWKHFLLKIEGYMK